MSKTNPHKCQFNYTEIWQRGQIVSPSNSSGMNNLTAPSNHRGDANVSVNKTTIASDNGLSPLQRQAIISTNNVFLLIILSREQISVTFIKKHV